MYRRRFRRAAAMFLALCSAGWPGLALGYPLDGYESTGIGRLEAQRLIQVGEKSGKKRPSGELLPLSMVDLRLLNHRDLELPASDPKLTARLKKLLGPEASRYGIALLDLSEHLVERVGQSSNFILALLHGPQGVVLLP